tara:strand:+ start:389 stop:637 length:249 start_codon:yes stop_codon:yes gene_type:complete
LLVKAPVQLRAVPKLAVPKLAVPKLAVSKLAVRAGGITVLSTFSAMAARSYCMDVLEEGKWTWISWMAMRARPGVKKRKKTL